MSDELEHGSGILRTILPVLLLKTHRSSLDAVGLLSLAEHIQYHAGTEAQRHRRGGQRSGIVLSAGIDSGIIVGLDTAIELSAIRDQVGVAVQPYGARCHHAVELQRSSPYVGVAGISLGYGRQYQHAVALLHQTHTACEGAAGQRMGISVGGDVVVVVVSLHPCRSIIEEDVGRRAVVNAHRSVASLAENNLLVVFAGTYAADNFLAAGHGEWWRSHGDAFQFAEEIADVGRLVVAAHLPHHGVAVLGVVPQCVVAPRGLLGGGIDTELIVGGAHDDFLAPVAQYVALIAGSGLRAVVGQSARQVPRTSGVEAGNVSVEEFFAEVAVPIDTEVHADVRAYSHMFIIDCADGQVVT